MVAGQGPAPVQEFAAGLPVVVSIAFEDPLKVAVALETWPDFVVKSGGTVVPAAGAIVHCASCVPATHGAATTDPTVREALANFVVSVAPTKRCWDVLR